MASCEILALQHGVNNGVIKWNGFVGVTIKKKDKIDVLVRSVSILSFLKYELDKNKLITRLLVDEGCKPLI